MMYYVQMDEDDFRLKYDNCMSDDSLIYLLYIHRLHCVTKQYLYFDIYGATFAHNCAQLQFCNCMCSNITLICIM